MVAATVQIGSRKAKVLSRLIWTERDHDSRSAPLRLNEV